MVYIRYLLGELDKYHQRMVYNDQPIPMRIHRRGRIRNQSMQVKQRMYQSDSPSNGIDQW